MNKQIYCRVAPSLGALDADHEYGIPGHTRTWGTIDYNRSQHSKEPTVFFGLYDLRDYIALSRHKGQKWVLWAGSDLENLVNGFAFNDGKLKQLSVLLKGVFTTFIMRILMKAEHWVEDIDEANKLAKFGIKAEICPSFMGDVEQFGISYKVAHHPNIYISGHPGREDEYGFETVKRIAPQCPDVRFHVYGSMPPDWKQYPKNVILHGKVSREEFNRDIRSYQCGLRLNKSDGFSEITAKSILMGQYAITYLQYPMIPNYNNNKELVSLLNSLRSLNRPNKQGRDYYMSVLNNYPWNIKKKSNV